MEDRLIALFRDTKPLTKGFQKKTYMTEIGRLKEEYADLLEELRLYLEQPDAPIDSLSRCIAESAARDMEKITSKRKREMETLDNNMAMVSFFLPLIRDVKSVRAEALAQEMVDVWNQTFTGTKIGCPTIEEINGGFKTGFCYVTTAVCRSLNKPDDCYELNLLREYRDGYMMSDEQRRRVVQEYYNIAPTIVKRIDRLDASGEVYEMIWETYVKPCIRLIEEERLADCEKVYTDMVHELETKYLYQ